MAHRFISRVHKAGRFWGQADINRQAKPADSVENDPNRTVADTGRDDIVFHCEQA